MSTTARDYQIARSVVVVEVRGGVIVGVYSDVPNLLVNVVDWDEIEDTVMPSAPVNSYAASALLEIPEDTRHQLSYGFNSEL